MASRAISWTLTLTPVSFSYSGARVSLTTVPQVAGRKMALRVTLPLADVPPDEAPDLLEPPPHAVTTKAAAHSAARRARRPILLMECVFLPFGGPLRRRTRSGLGPSRPTCRSRGSRWPA